MADVWVQNQPKQKVVKEKVFDSKGVNDPDYVLNSHTSEVKEVGPDGHDLRLLCNWHLQWCFVNTKIDSAYFKLTETAEWKMPLGGPEARNQEIHELDDSRKLFYMIDSFTGLQNQLHFCCQYWIIVATMAVSEKIGDAFISWIPMGLKHEPEIDCNLLELRGDIAPMYWRKASSYGQTRRNILNEPSSEHENQIYDFLNEEDCKAGRSLKCINHCL
nr:putative HVA22-like protein G isoform X1 [Ipomoea batatas]